MIRPVAPVAALAAYALADPAPPGAVSLAQNESAFPPSPRVAEVLAEARGTELYPDPDWSDLRHTLADVHGVGAGGILCGAGSMELIGALIRAYAGPGDEVLAPRYGYLYAASATALAGARYVTAAEPAFTVDVEALLAAVTHRTRIVFLCNPGNPTGTAIPNAEVAVLRARLPGDVLLIVDQAYGEFDGQDPRPVFDLVARGDTVVLRTLSKAYGLAGARVGWGLFPPQVASELRKVLNPNNIPAASQHMAVAALGDPDYMRQVVAETARRRDRFTAGLRSLGLDVPESRTNFVLIPFDGADIARQADAALRAAGLILRGMGGYGLPHALRATVGSEEAMDRALAVITEVLGGTR